MSLRIAHHRGKAARRVSGEWHLRARRCDGKRLFFELDALLARLIFVGVVGLLGQHRHELALEEHQFQVFGLYFFRGRINRDQRHATLARARHIVQIAVRLVTDEERHVRHQRGGFGRNTASAIGLKTLRDQMHTVSGPRKARQIQINFGFALVIGLGFSQRFGKTLLRELRIVKLIITPLCEHRQRRLQRHGRGHATRLGGRAKQVLQ